MEYRFATPADREDILDFINMIFSMVRKPHDFSRLIPKVYGPGVECSGIHALAIKDGRIRGCVGVHPFSLTVADVELRVGYVGSVSVHPAARGEGVMKRLMDMQLERARQQKLDMLVLGGQRQRYEYYGFEPCGGTYCYHISGACMRHALKDVATGGVAFERLVDETAVEAAYAFYMTQPVTGARTKQSFVPAAISFNGEPWLITRDNKPIGYLIAADGHEELRELVTERTEDIAVAIKAWAAAQGQKDLHVLAAPHQVALNRVLAAFAEGYSIGQNGMVNCLNPEKVIGAYMRLKSEASPLDDGVMRLSIKGHNTLRIAVQAGRVDVSLTQEPADATLEWLEAAQLLFGFNRFGAPQVSSPRGWFPLPLSIPVADTF